MSDIDAEIRNATEAFTRDLSELIRQAALESVSSAFGQNGARVRGRGRAVASAAVAPARGRRKGQKRSADELQKLQQRLLSAITANPGSRMEHLSKSMGASTRDLMLVTRKLLAEKAIKKRGQKRATSYFPGK